MAGLETAARKLIRSLDVANRRLLKYYDLALAVGRASPDPTERGFDAKQIRHRLQAEVIARLSPKPRHGETRPILQLNGAPEARRFVAARPLPGLAP
jgi:hypothetical protein